PDLRRVRLGIPVNHYFSPIHPEVESAVRAAIAHLVQLGAEVREVSFPDHDVLMAGIAGLAAERLVYHGRWMRTRLEDYGEDVQASLLANQFILAEDYSRALRARRLLRARYDDVLGQVDVIVAPTVPALAPTVSEAAGLAPRDASSPLPSGVARNTFPANLVGLPAITVPCGFAAGLPVGLMILGRPFAEDQLLRIAAAYEATTDWHCRIPPLARA
ncbi:MAG: amidase family protein, partial [Chloroflexota bacterium]